MNLGRKNKNNPLLKVAVRLVIILLIIALIYSLPVFRLQHIVVEPVYNIEEEEILAAADLIQGQHLIKGLGGSLKHYFQLRYKKAEDEILAALPYVKTVQVRMDFPGRINIQIEERSEVAYLNIPDGCVLIDKEAYALAIRSQLPVDIPVIEGIRAVSLSLGRPLTVDVTSSLQLAVTIIGAIIEADRDEGTSVNLMRQVKKIRPAGGNYVYLTVILPDTDEELIILTERGNELSDDMIWLKNAIEQGKLSGHGKGLFDLTGKKRIFRPDS